MTPSLAEALRRIVGPRWVRDRKAELATYMMDGLPTRESVPGIVVMPGSQAEVVEVLRLLHLLKLPFVARGAGTGLSGGALAESNAVLLTLTRLNGILSVDRRSRRAVVQPGVVNARLSEAVAPFGLQYVPDPSSQTACTVGGNVAENAGGPHCLKYGVTTNHVLGLEVVMPDGDIVWLGGKTREACGYDLAGVFVGSEGTFGIATKVVVRILKKPQAVKTVLAVFDEIDRASAAVSAIIGRGLVPAAIEMIDHLTIQAVEDAFNCGYPRDADAALLIELDGLAVGMEVQAERIVEACRDAGAREIRTAKDEAERQLLWKGRKSAFGAYGRVSPAYMVMDGVIPRTKLPYVLRRVNEIVAAAGLRVGNVFHAGDGNLHPNLLYDPRKPGDEARVLAAGAEIMKVCAEVGGSISGEHGIGLEKSDFMPFIFSAADLALMKRLKNTFNPTGLCNPGKIFPTKKSCVEVGPVAYRPHAIEEKGLAQRF